MKTALPLVICATVLLYTGWMLYVGRSPDPVLNSTATVEITVRGPDGKIIPPVRRAP